MSLLNSLTIKNLILNKKRTIVTIIGIILSVALITAVASMYVSGIESIKTYEKKVQGNFHVGYNDVSKSDINIFRNNRSINELNLISNLGYAKINSNNAFKPYVYIKALDQNALKNMAINLVEGRMPENDQEIVIPTHLKTNGRIDYTIGEEIILDIGTRVSLEGNILNQFDGLNIDHENNIQENIINKYEKKYKVVGIMERPSRILEGYSSPGYTFITFLSDLNNANMLDVYVSYKDTSKVFKNTANIIGVDETLFEKASKDNESMSDIESNKLTNEMKNAKYEFITNEYLIALELNPLSVSGISQIGVVVAIVIGIIVFTSIFCIKNSFDISITEKIRQYGMLRSIGATKKQIRHNVFYEATILGIVGIPLGILCGFLASYILIIISNILLKTSVTSSIALEFSISLIAIIVACILGIVTIYLSAFQSARKSAKVSPIDSIRNSAGIKISSKKLKSSKLVKKLFGIGGEISYKNLKRNKKKYRTTIISITVSIFMFIALSSFMNMAFASIDEEIGLTDYNINIYAYNVKDIDLPKYKEILSLDNINNYSFIKSESIKANLQYNKEYYKISNDDSNYIEVITLGDKQYSKYIKELGLDYEFVKDKAILYDFVKIKGTNTDTYLRKFNYKQGDVIELNYDTGLKNVEIATVTDKLPFGFKNNLNEFLLVSDDYYDKNIKIKNIEIVIDSSDANKLQDQVDNVLKGYDYHVNNKDEQVRTMNNLFILVGIFLYGFIIVISLIGITNIFNTITTNVFLRRQEFAMLKSVGMTNNEFNRMIRLESLFIGIKALVFGIPIGIILSYLLYYGINGDNGILYKAPYVAIIISIVAVFLLISLIMKYSINKINKENIIENLRNENI